MTDPFYHHTLAIYLRFIYSTSELLNHMDHPRFVNSLTGTHFATNWGNGKQTEKKIR